MKFKEFNKLGIAPRPRGYRISEIVYIKAELKLKIWRLKFPAFYVK